MKVRTNQQLAMHVSWVTILWNVALSAAKFFAGIFAHSGAMISDAVHSASDVLSTFVVIAGVKIAGKKPDREHPYGHERMESIAAMLLAGILLLTGIGIGISGCEKIFAGNWQQLEAPGALALIAAILSIVVKEIMYWYTRAAAKKIESDALMADAWHHRSDALSSIGSFAGILGARLGLPILDPIASVVICIFICKVAVSIGWEAICKVVDRACDETLSSQISQAISEQPGVLGVDRLDTRMFGSRVYVDAEICADGNATLYETHAIAQQVHDCVEDLFPKVKHCMVHVNPSLTPEDSFCLQNEQDRV